MLEVKILCNMHSRNLILQDWQFNSHKVQNAMTHVKYVILGATWVIS
jgi:hypothetical protein